ncbi:MAG: ABC transporter permease [Pelagibacterium sp. SCN 64-44]|nr:MAG: ABC transporter permease [Pelagibacterium sp. SCN 64-44]
MNTKLKLYDLMPLLVVLAVCLIALSLISFPLWVNLTIAGLSVGIMIFLMASGLTLIFGMMDVLNFAHAALITLAGYITASVYFYLPGWVTSDSLALNILVIAMAALASIIVTGILGFLTERIIIRPVYGSHLKQVLVTTGVLIIIQQLAIAIWGADLVYVPQPGELKKVITFGQIFIENYRLLICLTGLVLFAGMVWLLERTRIGLLVRAAVEDREAVESLGYEAKYLFVGVFAVGSALAGLGGTFWSIYQEVVFPDAGLQIMIMVFSVIIIGGLGSVTGCFVASILLGLLMNYVGFLVPGAVVACGLILLLAVLIWRPHGFYPVVVRR